MLRPIQNGCHFADDIFNFILLNEICCALTDVSQTLFLRDQLTNRRHKIQMMVLHRSGDKPLSHSNDVIMSAIAQITSLTTVYSTVYSGADQKKTSNLRVTGPCAGNSQVTDEFPAQRASNAENVSIWWRHHAEQMMAYFTDACILLSDPMG